MITLPIRPGTARRLGIRRPPPASRPYGLFQIMRPMTPDEAASFNTRLSTIRRHAGAQYQYIVAQPPTRGGAL